MNIINIPTVLNSKEITIATERICKSKIYTNFGDEYYKLQDKISSALKLEENKDICITSSGHVALLTCIHDILNKSKIGKCVTPAWSFASTKLITALFNQHKFIDVGLDGFVSLADLVNIKNSVVVIVSPFGELPSRKYIKDLYSISKKNNLSCIFDFAAALPNCLIVNDDRLNLILKIGPVCFSLHVTKLISTLEGGCIVSKKSNQKRYMKLINFGFSEKKVCNTQYAMNGKLSEINAAIGLISYKWFDKNKIKLKNHRIDLCNVLENKNIKVFNRNAISLTMNIYKNNTIKSKNIRRWWQVFDNKINSQFLFKNIIGIPLDITKSNKTHINEWFSK